MINRTIIALTISGIFVIASCTTLNQFETLSQTVYKSNSKNKSKGVKHMEKYYHNLRLDVSSIKSFSFIDYNRDTIFIISSFDVGGGGVNSSIFNNKGCISFTAGPSIEDNEERFDLYENIFPYSEKFKADIILWDTTLLRKYSDSSSSNFSSIPPVNLNRVIIENNTFKVEVVKNIQEY